jgi:hypothetical protein
MAAGTGVAAGRPQPQTTVESAGGPFVRHSQPGRRAMYATSGTAFGGLVNNPMVAAPGYTRGYRVNVVGSGGTSTSTTALGIDYPFNFLSLVQLKDSFGTPLIVAPGFEALNLIQLFGGQYGTGINSNALAVGTTYTTTLGAGNVTFSSYLPLEFAKAYGVISSANASLLPTLQMNLSASAGSLNGYFTTAPGTVPTFAITVDQDFYWLPEGVSIEPPGLGTTCQWVYQPCNPTISSGGTLNVQAPRLGGYLSTIIAELRDANGVRTSLPTNTTQWNTSGVNSGWGPRVRVLVDGVPLIDSLPSTLLEDMAISWPGYNTQYGAVGGAAPSAGTAFTVPLGGVIALSRKNGLSQESLGLFDTGEAYLSTNPGTQVEFACAPWGGIMTGPATLNIIAGQVVPSGALIQGLPEV